MNNREELADHLTECYTLEKADALDLADEILSFAADREAKGRREAVEKVAAKIKEVEALYLEWRTSARALDDNETTRCRGQQAIAIRHVLAEVNSMLSPASADGCKHLDCYDSLQGDGKYCRDCSAFIPKPPPQDQGCDDENKEHHWLKAYIGGYTCDNCGKHVEKLP